MATTTVAGRPSEPSPLTSATLGPLLSISDVAEILHLSENSIRWFVQVGRLPALKIGRRRLIRREDLDAFIRAEMAKGAGATP